MSSAEDTGVVVTDLDRTVIYSSSALLLADTATTIQRLVCVEIYKGKPLSYMTEKAAETLGRLSDAGILVPATTRTVEQYQRIALPGQTPKFALCANGGRLLRDGQEDLDFTVSVTARLASAGAPLAEMLAELSRASTPTRRGQHPFVEKVRNASDLFCYAVVDRRHTPPSWVADLTAFAAEHSWTVSVQGRKVYLMPAALTKATAAREVAEMMGAAQLLSAGDSLLDADMLTEADVAIRPAHGELAEAGWERNHVQVTLAKGVLAGEEIVSWMADQTQSS